MCQAIFDYYILNRNPHCNCVRLSWRMHKEYRRTTERRAAASMKAKTKTKQNKCNNTREGQGNWYRGLQRTLAPEKLVSRDRFHRPVPRHPVLFVLHTQAESGACSWDSSRFPRRRPFIYLDRHTPSSQSRVNRVTKLRTDVVHQIQPECGE